MNNTFFVLICLHVVLVALKVKYSKRSWFGNPQAMGSLHSYEYWNSFWTSNFCFTQILVWYVQEIKCHLHLRVPNHLKYCCGGKYSIFFIDNSLDYVLEGAAPLENAVNEVVQAHIRVTVICWWSQKQKSSEEKGFPITWLHKKSKRWNCLYISYFMLCEWEKLQRTTGRLTESFQPADLIPNGCVMFE